MDRNDIRSAFDLFRPDGTGPFIIFCDHASNYIPEELNGLGLPLEEIARHIAWDIGAAGIARELSSRFDSPAILSSASRLLVDCNRHPVAWDLIPEISELTVIPGNRNLSEHDRGLRLEDWFTPYHDAIESVVEHRRKRDLKSIALSIHSMTDNFQGNFRPWQIAFSSHTDRRLVEPMLNVLRGPGDVVVGDNEPYNLDPAVDYSIPFHAMRRDMQHLQVEFRQDEVFTVTSQIHWAQRFAAALTEAVL